VEHNLLAQLYREWRNRVDRESKIIMSTKAEKKKEERTTHKKSVHSSKPNGKKKPPIQWDQLDKAFRPKRAPDMPREGVDSDPMTGAHVDRVNDLFRRMKEQRKEQRAFYEDKAAAAKDQDRLDQRFIELLKPAPPYIPKRLRDKMPVR
jgi:hypothetical protein